MDRLQLEKVFETCNGFEFPVTLADPDAPDYPLIHVNPMFEDLTGYQRDEVVGLNCRFLNGPSTDAERAAAIGKACREGRAITEFVVNYRKDGSKFLNFLAVRPIAYNETHSVLLGCQYEFKLSPTRMHLVSYARRMSQAGSRLWSPDALRERCADDSELQFAKAVKMRFDCAWVVIRSKLLSLKTAKMH